MVFTVLVRTDPAAESPVTFRDEAREADPDVEWRFTATTEDREEALRWLELLRKECGKWRPPRPSGSWARRVLALNSGTRVLTS